MDGEAKGDRTIRIALVGVCSKQNIGDAAIHVAAVKLLKAVSPNASISSHTLYSAASVELYPEILEMVEGHQYFPAILPTLRLTPKQQLPSRLATIGYLSRGLLLLLLCHLLPAKADTILTGFLEKKALNDIASADLIVGAPGFRFSDTSGGLRGAVNCFIELYPLILSGIFKRRRVMLGVSLGEFRGRLCRWLVRRTANGLERVFVRELETMNFLMSCGVDPRVVELVPDLAFSLKRDGSPAMSNYPVHTNQHRKIAVAIGTPASIQVRRRYYRVISDLLDYLIESKDAHIFMVPHTKETSDQSDDEAEIPKVLGMLKRKERV